MYYNGSLYNISLFLIFKVIEMISLESLRLSGNPIGEISVEELSSLVHLNELRLDNMFLTSFNPTSLFTKLPALR